MGWSHPNISLEDLLSLIKGFVDMLILSSGYQSSGLLAHWDAENIKKVIQWGLFFEEVFRRLQDLDSYHDSARELDTALLELRTNPYFPQGLAHLSSATLTKARDFVLQHLLQTLPLRDEHLNALLTATIKMDLDDLSKAEYDFLNVYIDKLMLRTASLNLVQGKRGFIKDSMTSYPIVDFLSKDQPVHDHVSNPGGPGGVDSVMDSGSPATKEFSSHDHSGFVIRDVLKRQNAVSCISLIEKSLDVLSELVTKNEWVGSYNFSLEDCSLAGMSLANKEKLKEFALWNRWKARSLSYLLENRTNRLVSGAILIFSAPKVQWLRVFESLKASNEAYNNNLLEIIELLLLGFISSRWSCVIKHFISVSYDSLPISKQYYDVYNTFRERSQHPDFKDQMLNSKELDILEYLTAVLNIQIHKLWDFPPVLAAAAIPSSSALFGLYLSEIEKQMRGDPSRVRCCTCSQDGKEHKECEIAERICWLYGFHSGSPSDG
eukprot:TRINITY_DN17169_c0_g1_i2.p1 TRINITY_DN17169_c0_g1~~TRINITY_DN17169_c0_g1_i2.p1  ORF type:complete len:491 (+),score=94.23 TRINITY_DN17169_c0_g1_i2:239-1711(+)